MRLALFQPDIPQNTGAVLRLGACLGLPVDIIEPCGFPLSHASLRRAGMDYLEHVEMVRHADFDTFLSSLTQSAGRLILLTTKAETPHTRFAFADGDVLLLGRESAGVPQAVHEAADARIKIPMRQGLRSLNVALAAAMVAGEALRQLGRLDG